MRQLLQLTRRQTIGTATEHHPVAEPVDGHLAQVCALFKDRCSTIAELADWLSMLQEQVAPAWHELTASTDLQAIRPALATDEPISSGIDTRISIWPGGESNRK